MKSEILNAKMKKRLKRILIGLGLFCILIVIGLCGVYDLLEARIGMRNTENIRLILSLLIYLAVGHDILMKALRNLRKGQWMDEIFLMVVASLGAFVLGEYDEAIAVVLFYETGEFFQDYAVKKSRKSISELMDVRPVSANLKTPEGVRKVSPDEVNPGDILVILPGEKIPVDGVVVKGESSIDKKAMTGESVPFPAECGDELLSGCINLNAVLEMKATVRYADSTVSRVLQLMQQQGRNKAKTEEFISRFARYYTPAVVILAVLIALVPSLIFREQTQTWIYRALTFLVISCPCALVLSVPLGFFGGIGGASNCGILIKGAGFIERLSRLDTIVFDKTGTLTKGSFAVVRVDAAGDRDTVLRMAAACEQFSTHPIAVSIRNAAEGMELPHAEQVQELSGLGISAQIDEKPVLLGNRKLMLSHQIMLPEVEEDAACTMLYVAYDGAYLGVIFVADTIKDNAKETLEQLKRAGVTNMVMLTGDRKESAQAVAGQLGITQCYAELLPQDKVDIGKKIAAREKTKRYTAFVGDGINDAPVLAGADVGISFGGIGSDAAVEASDVVIMNDDLSRIPLAVTLSRKTMRIVRENITFALGAKTAVLVLSACGITSMWLAVIADVGVCMIAVLNALRTIRVNHRYLAG